MTNNHYTMKAIKTWYNPTTKTVSDKRIDKNCIRFDSKGEFNLYKELEDVCQSFNISIYKDCKLTVGDTNWLVDFKLVFPIELNHVLINLVKKLHNKDIDNYLPVLYIEYKGVLTSDTETKLKSLSDTVYNNTLIMVSNKPMAFMIENTRCLTYICKPIFSHRFFMLSFVKELLRG